MRFLVMSYGDAKGNGRGLYSCVLDRGTQTLQQLDFIPLDVKPGAALQVGPYVWVTYKDVTSKENGVMVYQLHKDGSLHWLHNRVLPAFFSALTHGASPDHVLAASFHDGVDAVLDARKPGDVLGLYRHPFRPRGPDERQQAAHSHFIGIMPHLQCIYSVDLGTDQVLFYPSYAQQSAADTLAHGPASILDRPLGSGPRLMPCTSTQSGRRPFAYLLHELANSISVLQWQEAAGQWQECQQISTLVPGSQAQSSQAQSSAAGFRLTPDENYLVVSNRGEDSIVLYRRDVHSGLLTECDRLSCGAVPRDIWVSNTDVMVLAQQGNRVEWYEIDTHAHRLQRKSAHLAIPAPVGVSELIY